MNTKEGKLIRASIAFAVKMINLHDTIERKAYLKNQLARAATSIGANIHEANYAESGDDFVHKMRIALKECHETEYWLNPALRSEMLLCNCAGMLGPFVACLFPVSIPG